jgi:ABC-type Mn2+/Zn2+ transport system permease subunit
MAIGIFFAGAMALGVFFIGLKAGYNVDLLADC